MLSLAIARVQTSVAESGSPSQVPNDPSMAVSTHCDACLLMRYYIKRASIANTILCIGIITIAITNTAVLIATNRGIHERGGSTPFYMLYKSLEIETRLHLSGSQTPPESLLYPQMS